MSCSLTDSQKGLNYILKTQGYVSYLKWKTDGEIVQNFVLQESMGVDSNKKDVSSEKKMLQTDLQTSSTISVALHSINMLK